MILVGANAVEDLTRFNLPGSYGRSTFENPEFADSDIYRNFIYCALYLVDTLLQLGQYPFSSFDICVFRWIVNTLAT